MKLAAISTLALLTSCSITQTVSPIPEGTEISMIAIEENPTVHMEGLLPEMQKQLTGLGFGVVTYAGDAPADADCTMQFTANWGWDMAMYLTYFRADVYSNEPLTGAESGKTYKRGVHLGHAEYNAMRGGANMGKFGDTGQKIAPLLRELFNKALIAAP